MLQEVESKKSVKFSYTALFVGAGLVSGGILGLLIDNLAFSAGGGMILALALGLVFEKKRKSE